MIATALFALLVCTQVPDETRCVPREMTPIGTINQSGYTFDYQSGWGDGCRIYRLRNTPKGVLTPVLWREHRARDSFVFLDVELDASDTNSQCLWRQAVHLADEDAQKATTYLGFGANKDQHNQTPVAFRAMPATVARRPAWFTTIIQIITGDDPDARAHTGIRATSSIKGEGPPFELTYTLRSLDPEQSFNVVRPNAKPGDGMSIVWDAASTQAFLAAFDRLEVKRLTPANPELRVTISVDAFDVVRSRQLRMVNAAGRTVLGTSSAVYVPAILPR